MRTIKFRAWENGKMYYQVRCGGEFDGIPTAPTVWNESAGDWLNLTGQPYTEVMQFTGLTDKNGVEIYEGDILEGVNYEIAKPKKFVGVVEYDWNRFVVKAKRFPKYDLNKTLRIVGNIYENPELLADE